ncbi:SRPBCC domain-containing protein [Sphingomonas sp. MMS12-HWE2-04]|uniref:SRPBCC family protein n=1 Tax=Sphingomonas sp. MMS12-HWE2-04 TaxID=3234199 RepID=UPI00384EC0DB
MTDLAADTRTVVVERDFAHPPEKVWRALTQPHLIEEWLMQNDFQPVVGRAFGLSAEWGALTCEVLEVAPHSTLAYTWTGLGLESVVTWTLTPSGAGTHLRMEQTGFRADQDQAYYGAKAGWPRFFKKLDQVVAGLD